MDFSASEESENELHESDLFMDLISNNPIVLEKKSITSCKRKENGSIPKNTRSYVFF
jgi:hypothetical protein